jgi:hypothetical protein
MGVSASTEALDYLASLGVTVKTQLASAPASPAVVQTPTPVAIPCPPASSPQAVVIPVALPAPQDQKSGRKEGSWWLGLLASATVILLMLIVFLMIKGCGS